MGFVAPLVTALGGAAGLSGIGSILGGVSSLVGMFKGAPKAPPPVKAPEMVKPPAAAAAPTMANTQVTGAANRQRAGAAAATQSGTIGAGGAQGLQATKTQEKATLLA